PNTKERIGLEGKDKKGNVYFVNGYSNSEKTKLTFNGDPVKDEDIKEETAAESRQGSQSERTVQAAATPQTAQPAQTTETPQAAQTVEAPKADESRETV